MTDTLTAAVIGLGQVGSRFDEEPRPMVFSHVGAFLALPDLYDVAGGADPDAGQRERFRARCPGARAFADGVEMAAELKPDVISLATPPAARGDLLVRLLEVHRPRAVIAEKPLGTCPQDRKRLVEACAAADVPLIVNYSRRFLTVYQKCRAAIHSGEFGTLTSITVLGPNRLWSIGSHLIDLLFYLAGQAPESWRALPVPALDERGEPAMDVLCRFPDGVAGRVVTAGFRSMLLLEVDIVGTKGRIRVTGNNAQATLERFAPSSQYLGYEVLCDPEPLHISAPDESIFVNLARETHAVARGLRAPSCSGAQALATETLLDEIAFVGTMAPSSIRLVGA